MFATQGKFINRIRGRKRPTPRFTIVVEKTSYNTVRFIINTDQDIRDKVYYWRIADKTANVTFTDGLGTSGLLQFPQGVAFVSRTLDTTLGSPSLPDYFYLEVCKDSPSNAAVKRSPRVDLRDADFNITTTYNRGDGILNTTEYEGYKYYVYYHTNYPRPQLVPDGANAWVEGNNFYQGRTILQITNFTYTDYANYRMANASFGTFDGLGIGDGGEPSLSQTFPGGGGAGSLLENMNMEIKDSNLEIKLELGHRLSDYGNVFGLINLAGNVLSNVTITNKNFLPTIRGGGTQYPSGTAVFSVAGQNYIYNSNVIITSCGAGAPSACGGDNINANISGGTGGPIIGAGDGGSGQTFASCSGITATKFTAGGGGGWGANGQNGIYDAINGPQGGGGGDGYQVPWLPSNVCVTLDIGESTSIGSRGNIFCGGGAGIYSPNVSLGGGATFANNVSLGIPARTRTGGGRALATGPKDQGSGFLLLRHIQTNSTNRIIEIL